MTNSEDIAGVFSNPEQITGKILLEKMLKNQHVSRWEVFQHRQSIMKEIYNTDKYDQLIDEVDLLIESAKESL